MVEKKKIHWIWNALIVAGIVVILGMILVPNLIHRGCGGLLTACKSNLKNIGTGLEMYSTDYSGRYPRNLNQLTPNYLKTLPECPQAGYVTYRADFGLSAPHNTEQFEDYYFVECTGDTHGSYGYPPNFPAYTSILGLVERGF